MTDSALPTASLLTAALTGLLGGAACSDEHDHDQGQAASAGVVLSQTEDKTITYASFTAECDRRGGLVQTHAVCFGTNSCKGVSFNKYDYVLTEHTCKGLNTCGGMSCVVLPADQGRTGEAIYKGNDNCAGCHGSDSFTLYVRNGVDVAQAEAAFPARAVKDLTAIVAFGVTGYSPNGVAEAFMPGHHERYAVAEIKRVIEYLRTLPLNVESYGILGVDEDVALPEEEAL